MTIGYYEGFDYGGGIAEKEEHFILWPETGTRTALVDADLLPYRIAFVIDPAKELTAQGLVRDGHYKCIEDTPQFESAFESLCQTLNKWIRDAGCDSAKLYATDSAKNFRLDLAYTTDYKGQRPEEKPPFFNELKTQMIFLLKAMLSDGNEADDELSIEAWRRYRLLEEQGVELGSEMHKELCDSVTISIDKDSTITPTWHYNPDTQKLIFVDPLGELKPKFSNKEVNHYEYVGTGEFWKRGAKAGQEKVKRVLVGKRPSTSITDLKGTGLKFFYAQIIMGDVADNYKGLKGKGMTFAYNLLDNCKTEKEMYYAVLGAYKEVYGTGKHWCPNFRGTQEYYDNYVLHHNAPPPDWDFWKGKGAYLTAYDRMLEQGRLAWMQTYPNEIWRSKSPIIYGNDKEFWHDRTA
ncbi:exonuclease [Vibrio phage VP-HS15]|uniref:Exonuclease n=1 Tax=Vibrio phage VP-HS15 TaxID=2686284 RepID=A0A6B9LHC0_9CAUD|nr:exonuclease [Vibrio phage VP-HS15]